jgi:hypothetical protein
MKKKKKPSAVKKNRKQNGFGLMIVMRIVNMIGFRINCRWLSYSFPWSTAGHCIKPIAGFIESTGLLARKWNSFRQDVSCSRKSMNYKLKAALLTNNSNNKNSRKTEKRI